MTDEMELDVHLKRMAENESWGFRLIGGKDFNMPLTVVKVVPESPAEKGGLQNGDTVRRIDDADTCDLSHSSAKKVVDTAKLSLTLAVHRTGPADGALLNGCKENGLYDPVLDEYEPLYEPIDQEDFDQPSQPTEVDPFQIQQFPDTKQLPGALTVLPDLRDIETPSAGLTDRSLTASPFVLPTKPYRPFSTEPLPEIPALEDPIILNPNYNDLFGKLNDGEVFPETKFKLPISEQYDPDGTKKKTKAENIKTKDTSFTESKKEVTYEEQVEQETKLSKELQHKAMIEEMKFMEKMTKDIDLDKIEMTAVNIVDESIDKAVSVTDEIKKEIAIELLDVKEKVVVMEVDKKETASLVSVEGKKTISKEAKELVQFLDNASEKIFSNNESKSEISVAKEVKKFENVDMKAVTDERKLSVKQEIDETIISGNVRRQSEAFDKQMENISVSANQSHEVNKSEKSKVAVVKDIQKSIKEENTSQFAQNSTESSKATTSTSQKTNAKHSVDSKTTSKQNAYKIGLQTIPNIKDSIHSTCHYNLLLKTFFIHLTDVMVALSRFILTEPVFNNEESEKVETGETVSEYTEVSNVERTTQESMVEKSKADVLLAKKQDLTQEFVVDKEDKINTAVETKENVISAKMGIEEKAIEHIQIIDAEQNLEVEEAAETRMLSGAKMAQLVERKPEELTKKMGAVITEFQVKTGIEETAVARERRSRSRSRIEEEVALESDPLEWLSKQEQKHSKETVEFKSESCISSSESVQKTKIDSMREEKSSKCFKSEEGKQMYVAIVESHVFTNKDAIFQAQALDFSETSSVQSTEETNVTLQAIETVATETVALETHVVKQEAAKSVLEESRDLSIVNARSQVVEIAEEAKPLVQEVKEEKAAEVIEKQVQEVVMQEITEPVLEIKEIKSLEIKEDFQKVDFKEEEEERMFAVSEKTEVVVEEATCEIIEKQVDVKHEQEAAVVEEIQEIKTVDLKENIVAIREEENAYSVTDNVEETKVERYEDNATKKQQTTAVEETILETAVATIETATEKVEPVVAEVFAELNIKGKPAPTLEEASAELKIIKEQVLEMEQTLKLVDESELSINKYTEFQNDVITAMIQESSFAAKSLEDRKKLTLQLNKNGQRRSESQSSIVSDAPSTIDTPTPGTIPPTPLTDEYVFKLHTAAPKGDMPIPREISPDVVEPDDEDPHIVKKKLVPHVDIKLDSPIIYDPPLPSPPFDVPKSPVYSKPGLKGGFEIPMFYRRKEEILEIERKSSLLASAIDETIKCIEEYKEEVGIERKKEVKFDERTEISTTIEESNHVIVTSPTACNGFVKTETDDCGRLMNNKINDEWKHIDKQITENNSNLEKLSTVVNIEAEKEFHDRIQKEIVNEKPHVTFEIDISQPDTVSETNDDKLSSNIESRNREDKFNEPVDETAVSQVEVESAAVIYSSPAINHKEETEVKEETTQPKEEKREPLEGYRPVQFNPEELIAAKRNLQSIHSQVKVPMEREKSPFYMDASGEILGTHQGIVDGLEEAVVDADAAKELGKPGITEEKIAVLISGESEMLREAHVMGLSRVLSSHMHRPDDSSVDFKKIKPILDSLRDSEVLRALNEELIKTQEEKKKEERKWTTFMQKPKRPVPRAKFGYFGYIEQKEEIKEPYKVKIVKQPKPKVAPDYKPKDFETGPLPWEERALNEPPPPPVDAEDPILVPEELPEFFEAVDPLPESEVPDLEETSIPLPPPQPDKEEAPEDSPVTEEEVKEEPQEEPVAETEVEEVAPENIKEMDQNLIAEQLVAGVQNMVDPNASVEQQLAQMRAQLAALAQLPGVIQQTLELVTKQLGQLSVQETRLVIASESKVEEQQEVKAAEESHLDTNGDVVEEQQHTVIAEPIIEEEETAAEEDAKPTLTQEEMEILKKEEEDMLEEQRRIEKQKKELMQQMKVEQESRQIKQRAAPRVGKPRPVFGPPVPQERPMVLPGGRKWRKPQDAYNEAFIAETLTAQAEIIQGKAMGINFMKYEKPPVSLDHLQQSETYKLVHNMDVPAKRVDMLTPVIAEADYREKCRSVTPSCMDKHMTYPEQVHP